MKISQTLRKPANWQDFESLCLLLWRVEWKSEDVKKNGRNGQAQKGVDICGHRDGENDYSGIQCKCKPGNKALTQADIDEEIDNAKEFKPDLKRLVFATTADKDVAIEEYVRIKDDENRKAGKFTIDIKSWQDIVDMLERNTSVLNTYLDIVADDFAASVTFGDGSQEFTIRPKFMRTYYISPEPKTECRPKSENKDVVTKMAFGGLTSQLQHIAAMAEVFKPVEIVQARIVKGQIKTNHSYCPLKFRIVNQGRTPIDDYKLIFTFDNSQVSFIRDNVEKKLMLPDLTFRHNVSNVLLRNGEGVRMYGASLVPGDNAVSDDFFIHVPYGIKDVNISWELRSRNTPLEGKLKIVVESVLEDEYKTNKEKYGDTEINDFVETEDVTD